jgi:hypothetical protein|tara:strand:- start:3945 stop:4346 length:402 start_codon:yes stop_codon:yes gene_type:complete
MKTQLLCTFTSKDGLQKTLQDIRETYVIVYNYIYILQNKSNLDELYVTYNINTEFKPPQPLEDTILIHRKKESNTLYTINALNQLVREENGGVLDKTFVIDWQKFRNSIILTNTEGTKRIQTRIFEVIEFNQK